MFNPKKSNRNIELFIFDIFIAIQKIKKVASEFDDVEKLMYDFKSWDSIIREFEIIGEATKYLLKNSLLSKDYQVIVDFRNQITHAYFGIDLNIVWTIIHTDLKPFEDTIIELINNIEQNLKNELIEAYIKDNYYLSFIVSALKEIKKHNSCINK